jgi:hypothetical protein
MSTVELGNEGRTALSSPRAGAVTRTSRASAGLAAGLFAAIAYAAFAHGAVTSAAEPRLQVGVAALAAFAGAALIWNRTLRFSAPRAAYAGIAALLGFAAWSAVSIAVLCYVIVVCLAVTLGASAERPVDAMASGYLAIAAAVTCYALGQKLCPGLHAPGVFNLNQTAQVPRLRLLGRPRPARIRSARSRSVPSSLRRRFHVCYMSRAHGIDRV